MPGHWTSLPGMMLELAVQRGEAPMLRHWSGGAWRQVSWIGFARDVAALAAGLRARGVMPGDRVLLVSESRPEFPVADTAIMAIGGVTVPTYTTNTTADHAHILRDCGARAALVSSPRLAKQVAQGAADAGGLDLLAVMDAEKGELPEGAVPWSDLAAGPGDLDMLRAEAEQIPAGRLACLVYTSGTGGTPKGVMLPHRAMLANQRGLAEVVSRLHLNGTPYLSFLPLSHAYEHTVGNFLLPSLGMEVVYSRGADRLAAELQDVSPTIVTAVPRLFEVLRGRILAGLEKEKPWRRRLFERAVALGLRKLDGPPLNLLERVEDTVLDRLVRAKVRDRFGSRLVALVSGGARLDPDLSGFFLALGVPVLQGYGQTEAGPVVSVNLPWDNHRRTVGHPLPGVEAHIAGDGELLIRGDLVMDGYWNDPVATAAALAHLPGDPPDSPPWLHTGDVATIEEGRIVIRDRKKDFLKTLGGDMVSPAKIEGLLMAEPEIAQAVVAGEGAPAIVALLVPAEGADPAQGVAKALERVNAKLSNVERVRRWKAVPAFTLEEGLLTPTMKVRRRAVIERYAATLSELT
ncbi:AMP-binding protein [Roseomonas sp. OT10]|uniref:AMP-dependent synthetase/ligase n=1 Tax=Roseomonas cutis TaxID=2897332 RepID=UPI001E4FAB1C|nr:AMP-binding protein [Roseomonas sp. OT10]UFN47989.1 AMP-binding protein [Roseomonas sp. OT10]